MDDYDAVEPTDECEECGRWIYDEHNDGGVCEWCERENCDD